MHKTRTCSPRFTENHQGLRYDHGLKFSERVTNDELDDAILALAAIKNIKEPHSHVFLALEKEGNRLNIPELNDMLESRPKQGSIGNRDDLSHLLSVANNSRTWFHRCVEKHDSLGRLFQWVCAQPTNP